MIHNGTPTEPIILGILGSCYGIYGWLKVFSYTERAVNIVDYQPWLIKKDNEWKEIKLENWKYISQNIIVKIENINNRCDAYLMTNFKIIVDSSQLPQLDNENYYWKDLIGCRVITINNYDLGRVIDIIATGSNDVLVIKANIKDTYGIKERLVPFLYKQVIKRVELMTHTIKVDWDPNF